MTAAPSKLYSDDVSLLVVLLDANPFFWGAAAAGDGSKPSPHPAAVLSFSRFLNNVIPFLNSVLLLNQNNEVVLIAAGASSCGYIYSSEAAGSSAGRGMAPAVASEVLRRLEEFVAGDRRKFAEGSGSAPAGGVPSLLSGALSLALCCILDLLFWFISVLNVECDACVLGIGGKLFMIDLGLDIQRVFRSGSIHPQPRILCLQGSPDGPEQYVAVMNAIFSAQRSMVPVDSCVVGAQNSAFLQQASYITGGVYMKPQQLDALFQYLSAVFSTDLQSRSFLQLPRTVGVDFRASCFCHKKTIDMGYVCSVCLSIFCKQHKKCSTCGSEFNKLQPDHKRKNPEL